MFNSILNNIFGLFLYTFLSRELWTFSICWIIYACHARKSGGIIREIISWSFWRFIARMFLSAYFAHYLYIMLSHVSQKDLPQFQMWWQIHIFTSDIIMTYFFSILFYILIEAPTKEFVNYLTKNDDEESELKSTIVKTFD